MPRMYNLHSFKLKSDYSDFKIMSYAWQSGLDNQIQISLHDDIQKLLEFQNLLKNAYKTFVVKDWSKQIQVNNYDVTIIPQEIYENNLDKFDGCGYKYMTLSDCENILKHVKKLIDMNIKI